MNFQFDPIILPIILSVIIAIGLTLYAWRLRSVGSWATPFILLTLALAVWSIGYALELAALILSTKILWIQIQYIGIVITPVAWFLFAVQYSGREAWGGRRYIGVLTILPIITLLLVFTNETHQLIWRQIDLVNASPLPTLEISYGWWFWIHSVYSYILILLGTIILFQTLRRFPAIHNWQIGVMLLAPIVPLLGNGLYLSGLSPIPQLDLTALAFNISGLIFAWGIFRLHFFQIGPVARRTVVDNMSDGMIVLDLQNHIIDFNLAATAILEKKSAEIVGESLESFLDNGAELIAQFSNSNRDDGKIVLDIREKQKWYEIRVSPIHDANQHLRGRVLIFRNVTERKRSEAALALQNEILQTLNHLSQEMSSSLDLQTLLNTAVKSATQALNVTSAYINDWDLERNTTTVLAEYFAPSASITEKISDLGASYHLEADFGPPNEWLLEPAKKYVTNIDDEDIGTQIHDHMEQYGAKTIVEIPLYAKGIPLGTLELWESRRKRNLSGEEFGLLFEIARHIALAMDNAILYERALAVNKLKSRILARVSHELRTPLGIIKFYAEMMQFSRKFEDLPEESQQALSKIIVGADDLAFLIEELLDQSALDADSLTLQITSFSPATLLEKVQSQMNSLAENKGLMLSTNIESDIPEVVSGDLNRVQQILVNLVGNAIKYTEQGSVNVRFFCLQNDGKWAMEVSDTGPGISKEEQAFIFDPFRQGEHYKNGSQVGLGLGLSIVRQLVDLMAGQVNMESEIGKGSVFTVLLPLEK